jgi:hypothetical protein
VTIATTRDEIGTLADAFNRRILTVRQDDQASIVLRSLRAVPTASPSYLVLAPTAAELAVRSIRLDELREMRII